MTDIIKILENTEAAPQGNARLDELKKAQDELTLAHLKEYLFKSLSPTITYGVKQIPAYTDTPIKYPDDQFWFETLLSLLYALSERKLTGLDAQEEISEFLGMCTPLQRKWSERIIQKDLRLNIGAKEINNTFGKNTIPLFEVPLATDVDKCKDKDLKGVFHASVKLDGARTVAVLPGRGMMVRLYSRTGKEWGNFESIRNTLQKYNDTLNPQHDNPLYLDGEVISLLNGKVDFQALQKTLMRKDEKEVGYLNYVVFDAAYQDEWFDSKFNYSQRLDLASIVVESISQPTIKLIKNLGVFNNPEKHHLKYACDQAILEGHEGIMVRKDVPVRLKRTKDLIKVKTFQDAEATIIGYFEGTGKLEGTLGALTCRDSNGNVFEIGSGFDEETRKELWLDKDDLIGKYVTYKFQNITDAGLPRFPIFKGIRHEDDFS